MTVFQALALGVLQGATEFLPVSSSGHLALAQNFFAPRDAPDLLFDVVVHFGTVLAIVVILRERVRRLGIAVWALVSRTAPANETDRRWLLLLLVGSLPTAAIGLALRDSVGRVHSEPALVGAFLIATALILVLSERRGSRRRSAGELRVADALWVGAVQGLAVLPGLSRSASTVGTALWRDVRADTAVEFSMLLSAPAVLGANLYELSRVGMAAARDELLPLTLGFGTALISGALCLKALQWAVVQRRLQPFAAYCALLGVGAIVFG